MRKAVLIVDHGSRRAAANEQLGRIAELLRAQTVEDALVGTAHLELTPPTIRDGIDDLVRRGASQITVVPYMLAPGRHATSDIPQLAREAVSDYPAVELRIAECLGVDQLLVDLVLRRAAAAVIA